MSTLPEVIKALQSIAKKPRACCAIPGSDCLDELSLMGTKDGYLNLAVRLLQIVAASEGSSTQQLELDQLPEKHAIWSDNIKNALLQLPGYHPYIVGCCLFDDHQSFITTLEELVNPSLPVGMKLTNDPAFNEP